MPPTPAPNHQQLTERLLGHLRHEESLLHASKECLTAVHHALRQGNLKALDAARPHQEILAADLHDAAQARGQVTAELAQSLGLPPENPSLGELADRLPVAPARELLAVRESLRVVLNDVVELQWANANLVQTLRSYFRGVLSGLTTPDVPTTTRYGPTGGRLQTIG